MRLIYAIFALLSLTSFAFGEASAVYNSTYFKFPDQTNTSRSAISAGQTGYNTDTKSPEFWNGTIWSSLGGGGGSFNQGGNYTLTGSWTFNGPMAFGNPAAVRSALGAPASGNDSSITGLSAVQGQHSGDFWIVGPGNQGLIDSGFTFQASYTGSVPPGAAQDSTQGFGPGSFGVVSNQLWVCLSASPNAATWVNVANVSIAVYTGTTAPGPAQSAPTYSPASVGMNTAIGQLYGARSVGAGVAAWVLPSGRGVVNPVANAWRRATGMGAGATAGPIGSTTTMYVSPFFESNPETINLVGTQIAVSGTSNLRIAIYATDPTTNYATGTPILQTADIADTANVANGAPICTAAGAPVATCTGAGTPAAVNVPITKPGMYWAAIQVNDLTVAFVRPNAGLMAEYVGAGNNEGAVGASPDCAAYTGQTYGVFPDLTGLTPSFPNDRCGVLDIQPASVP